MFVIAEFSAVILTHSAQLFCAFRASGHYGFVARAVFFCSVHLRIQRTELIDNNVLLLYLFATFHLYSA